MAYQKQPNFHYNSLGGLNNKVSPYLNNQMEFLRLENYDFQVPGSLSQRWGSTQYFGNSLSGKVNGLYEFNLTTGASYFYSAAGGTLGIALSSGSFLILYSGSTAGASFFSDFGGTFIDGVSLGSFNLDFDTLQNQAFIANGKNFLKTSGISFFFFGLPRFQSNQAIVTTSVSGSGVANGFTGVYYYRLAFINSYGLAGAPTQFSFAGFSTPRYLGEAITAGATQVLVSATGYVGGVGPLSLVPPNSNISGVALFRSDAQGATMNGISTNALLYYLVGTAGVSPLSQGVTFSNTNPIGGITQMSTAILPWDWYTFSAWTITGLNGYQLNTAVGTGITLIPRFLETHDSRLFAAGMSYAPSTYYFSEFSEPEHWEVDFNNDVVTQNGEPITALKSYNGNLMIFKTSSFHQLNTSAAFPEDWVLTQISQEYGCLTNRAVTEYNDLLLFLDRKGIIRFNGANIEILSTKVDPIFQRMNVTAAKENACLTYDKQRNQILCDIPVDGATMNNLIVVWDIISNAWTTYSGYRPAITTVAQGSLNNEQIFYGGYSGLISYFGGSFLTDNGVGFTTIAKSGFSQDIGYSTEKLYRRLYTDTIPRGTSFVTSVNFYQDYGASVVLGATIALTPFQTKYEMGIPARSLAVEYVASSLNQMVLHGFTIEYRFLRNI